MNVWGGVHLALETEYRVTELTGQAVKVRNMLVALMYISLFISFAYVFMPIDTKRYSLPFMVFVFTFSVISVSWFELILDSQPFVEGATNFYDSARKNDFWHNLLVRDSGYFAVIQHLVAWCCVRVLHLKTYAFLAMNTVAVFFASAMNALLVTDYLTTKFHKKMLYILSVLLPIILVRQYESFTFINFVYFGGILLLSIPLMDVDGLKRWKYWFVVILVALLNLSKVAFAACLPFYAICLLYELLSKAISRRRLFLYFTVITTGIIQLKSYRGGIAVYTLQAIAELLKKTFYECGRIFLGLSGVLDKHNVNETVVCGIGLMIILLTCIGGLLVFIIRRNAYGMYIIAMNAVVFSDSFLRAVNPSYKKEQISLWYSRQEFLAIIACIFAVMLWTEIIGSIIYKGRKYATLLIAYTTILVCTAKMCVPYQYITESANTGDMDVRKAVQTDWKTYASHVSGTKFLLPVGRVWLSSDLEVLYHGINPEGGIMVGAGDYICRVHKTDVILQANNIDRIEVDRKKKLRAVYVKRTGISERYKMLLFDKNDNLVNSIEQLGSNAEVQTGFFIKSNKKISYVKFVSVDTGLPVYVRPDFLIAYEV